MLWMTLVNRLLHVKLESSPKKTPGLTQPLGGQHLAGVRWVAWGEMQLNRAENWIHRGLLGVR